MVQTCVLLCRRNLRLILVCFRRSSHRDHHIAQQISIMLLKNAHPLVQFFSKVQMCSFLHIQNIMSFVRTQSNIFIHHSFLLLQTLFCAYPCLSKYHYCIVLNNVNYFYPPVYSRNLIKRSSSPAGLEPVSNFVEETTV